MSAKTRLANENLGRLARLSNLSLQAAVLTAQDKRESGMVDHLLKALQLFKENRLGHVFPFVPEGDLDARKRFRDKIERFGEARAYRDFIRNLSGKGFAEFPNMSFRELVSKGRWELLRMKGFGDGSLARFELALNAEGLHVAMTPDEIEICFGPVIHRREDEDDGDVPIGGPI